MRRHFGVRLQNTNQLKILCPGGQAKDLFVGVSLRSFQRSRAPARLSIRGFFAMTHRSVERTLRSTLLNSSSSVSLSKARMVLLPIVFGAAVSLGIGFDTRPAMAADVVCSPDVSGDFIGNVSSSELCKGAGSQIDYATNPAVSNGNVTLQGVAITGGSNVRIDTGGFDVLLTDTIGNASSINGSTGPAIFMTGAGGNVTISLGNTTIAADPTSGSVAISAVTTSGSISITTANSMSADDGGILASSGSGPISIDVSGAITGDVNNGGFGDGIHASSTSGPITITTHAAGTISYGNIGISALLTGNSSSNISITTNADIASGNASTGNYAISAIMNNAGSSGNITVAINSGNVTAPGNASAGATVYVSNAGSGNISLSTGAATSITSTTSAGIFAQGGTGSISGTVLGTVSGDWAVNMTTGGAGTINMTYGNDVTGTDGAILQTTADGNNTLHITNASGSTVIDGGVGGNSTVLAQAFGNGSVSITTDAGTLVQNTPSFGSIANGLDASTLSGQISITANGNITSTNDAIHASSGSGNISISGSGTLLADNNDGGAGDGIYANTTTGAILINTTGFITGSSEDGINASSSLTTGNGIS